MTPKKTKDEIKKILSDNGIILDREKVCIIGIRGYYADTFGKPGVNDRNVYDDAIFVVSENDFGAFQANVDPSVYRHRIAQLVPGVYDAVKWRHKGKYDALQIVKDTVRREGVKNLDTGRHGINFHYGGSGTWSEGCQTFPQSSYWFFLRKVYSLMDKYGKRSVKYLLIDQ